MSRLIDADKLLEEIINQDLVTVFKDGFIKTICNQPTAYDKEKVIEELRENWFLGGWSVEHQGKSGTYYTDEEGKVVELHDAIKIVERGGVDD